MHCVSTDVPCGQVMCSGRLQSVHISPRRPRSSSPLRSTACLALTLSMTTLLSERCAVQSCGWLPLQGQAQLSFPAVSQGASPVSSGPEDSAGQPLHLSQNGGQPPMTQAGTALRASIAGEELGPLQAAASLQENPATAQGGDTGMMQPAVSAHLFRQLGHAVRTSDDTECDADLW